MMMMIGMMVDDDEPLAKYTDSLTPSHTQGKVLFIFSSGCEEEELI